MPIEMAPENLGKKAKDQLEAQLAAIDAGLLEEEKNKETKVGEVELGQIESGEDQTIATKVAAEKEIEPEEIPTDLEERLQKVGYVSEENDIEGDHALESLDIPEQQNAIVKTQNNASEKQNETNQNSENFAFSGAFDEKGNVIMEKEHEQKMVETSYEEVVEAQKRFLQIKSEGSKLDKVLAFLGSKGNQDYVEKTENARVELESKKNEFRKNFGAYGQVFVNRKRDELKKQGEKEDTIKEKLLEFMQLERFIKTGEKDEEGNEIKRSLSEEYNHRLFELDKIRVEALSSKAKMVFKKAWEMYRKIPPKFRFAASLTLALGIGAATGGLAAAGAALTGGALSGGTTAAAVGAGAIAGKRFARWKIGAMLGAAGAGATDRIMSAHQSLKNVEKGQTEEDFREKAEAEFSIQTNRGLDFEKEAVVEKGLLIGLEARKKILDEMNLYQKKQLRNRMIAAGMVGAATGFGAAAFAGGFLDSTLSEGDAKIFKQWAKESNAEDLFSDEELNKMRIYGGREDIAHETFEKKVRFRLLQKFAKETALKGEMKNWVDEKGYEHVRAENSGAVYEYVTDKNGKIIDEKVDASKLRAQWDSKNKMFKSVDDEGSNSKPAIKSPVVQSAQMSDSSFVDPAPSSLQTEKPVASDIEKSIPKTKIDNSMVEGSGQSVAGDAPESGVASESASVLTEKINSAVEKPDVKEFTLEKGDSVWKILKAQNFSDRDIMNKLNAFSKEIGEQLMKEKGMNKQQAMAFINGRFSHMDIGESFELDAKGNIKCESFLNENKLQQFETGKWKIETFQGKGDAEIPKVSNQLPEKEQVVELSPEEQFKQNIIKMSGIDENRNGFDQVLNKMPESFRDKPDFAAAYTKIFVGNKEEIGRGLKDLFGFENMPVWSMDENGLIVVEDAYGNKGFNLLVGENQLGVDGPSKWNWGMEKGKLFSRQPIESLTFDKIGAAREFIESSSEKLKLKNIAHADHNFGVSDEDTISGMPERSENIQKPETLNQPEDGTKASLDSPKKSYEQPEAEAASVEKSPEPEESMDGLSQKEIDMINGGDAQTALNRLANILNDQRNRTEIDRKSLELFDEMTSKDGGRRTGIDFGHYVQKYVNSNEMNEEKVDALFNMYKKLAESK